MWGRPDTKSVLRQTTPAPGDMARKKEDAKRSSKSKSKAKPKAKSEASGGVKRPHKWLPGTVALRQVRKAQRNTEMRLGRRPFQRFIRTLSGQMVSKGMAQMAPARVTAGALEAIRAAVEAQVVETLQDAHAVQLYVGRMTLYQSDLAFVRQNLSQIAGNKLVGLSTSTAPTLVKSGSTIVRPLDPRADH